MKTYHLGLTGSIGMGKSTTAAMFAAEGVPVWDADAAVQRLYAPKGAGSAALAQVFPEVITKGAVSRPHLRALIAANPATLDQINALIHPLVAADRAAFLAAASAPVVLLDIPLLFESGSDALCDGIIVVTAPADVQRRRVLDRGTMTDAALDLILARQMPDAQKRARATWVIETINLDSARAAVKMVLQDISKRRQDA